jgi:hypothetical protein
VGARPTGNTDAPTACCLDHRPAKQTGHHFSPDHLAAITSDALMNIPEIYRGPPPSRVELSVDLIDP